MHSEELAFPFPISFSFYLVQFFSNFFKYLFSNLLSPYPNKLLLSFLLVIFLLFFFSFQILWPNPLHFLKFSTLSKSLSLLYNSSISLDTLISLSSLIYSKYFLLYLCSPPLSLLKEIGSSSIPLPVLYTLLSFSH